jgi:multidrug efflux pump subunit AcrA (membrane-fusion protein)
MERGLFRDEAVRQLTAPERLDERLRLVRSREWLALTTIALLGFGILGWAVFGRVEMTIGADGVVLRRGGVVPIPAPATGTITRVAVTVAETVEPGGVVATLAVEDGREAVVDNPLPEAIRVLEVPVAVDQPVAAGSPIVYAELAAAPLEAVVYLSPADRARIEPGMVAKVWPASTRELDGYVKGVVGAVAPFLSTRAEMARALPSGEQVERSLEKTDGSPFEVRVALVQSPGSPSGVAWSTGDGTEDALTSGLPARVDIVFDEERPIQLVLPGEH